MSLHCPFCHAPEDSRVDGSDDSGNHVVLLMFNCPFYFRMPAEVMDGDDSAIQCYLDDWKSREGDAWLDSIGPVMKNRELENIVRRSPQPS
jgi:hypothetical protein